MSLARLTHDRLARQSSPMAASGVSVRRDGRAVHLRLTRPRHLNALDHDMVTVLRATLEDLVDETDAEVVVLSGAGDRGLCAGGDLRFLHDDARSGGHAAMAFWRDLYDLVEVVADHPLPIVSLMDGIVLGGGLGVAARAQHRVVTERSVIGMPETRIGFFPDTGGLHLLSHLERERGTYLALCAETVGAADALDIGLADHFVWHSELAELRDQLAVQPWQTVLDRFRTRPPEAPRLVGETWIDECFAGGDVSTIVSRLRERSEPAAAEAADLLASRSPSAVAVTLAGLRRAAGLSLSDDLTMELRLAERLRSSHDFLEGIRARLVDKDREPQWEDVDLAAVDTEGVEALFG